MARIYKAKFRVESDEVQGPGSWVEFQRPTWGLATEAVGQSGKRLLELCIVAWNWTDDNDNPLPMPKDNPGMIDTLPAQEADWLTVNSGMMQREENLKNSSSPSLPI